MSYFPLNTHDFMWGMEQLGQICQFVPDKSYSFVNSGLWENMDRQGEYLGKNKTIYVIIYNHLIIPIKLPSQSDATWLTRGIPARLASKQVELHGITVIQYTTVTAVFYQTD